VPTREPATGRARLILLIEKPNSRGRIIRTTYFLRFLSSDPQIGAPAWRLTKTDGSVSYDVILLPTGAECTCADATFRRQNEEVPCKHVRACKAAGLLR